MKIGEGQFSGVGLPLVIAAALLSGFTASAADRPNVVLMMADDLGYHDLSCYGSDRIRTPELDRMASEGVRLTSFYAGCTVCTPSRMALLTGAYPRRAGWPGSVGGYRIPWENGLATEAVTIAEIFQAAGYATGMCGKWHLGDGDGMQPTKQGFDSAYYIKASNNQTKKLWRSSELIADPFDNRLLTEQFTAEAIRFIRSHRNRPFFLYLPFTAPHFPAQPHPDWKGRSSNAAYGDVVEELDSRIGEINATLKQEQLDRKTIVVFLSDNGPEKGQRKWASAEPFRGLKWTSLEGGNRVPCIIRWPGMVPANHVSDELTAAIDLLPTLVHACGLKLNAFTKGSPKIDGVNVWATVTNQQDSPHPRSSLLFWNGWAKLEAIRVGTWKLFLSPVSEIPDSKTGPVLIDLKHDPSESMNLAQDHPDRVAAMRELAETLAADIESNSIPLGGPSPARP